MLLLTCTAELSAQLSKQPCVPIVLLFMGLLLFSSIQQLARNCMDYMLQIYLANIKFVACLLPFK